MGADIWGPRVLYLDMNVWVDMARGCRAADPVWRQIRDCLTSAVEGEALLVVLSSAHYLELLHRADARSRRELAGLMRDVTGYRTIAPPYVVRRLEADDLVTVWEVGASMGVRRQQVLGRGAAHAFGRPEGRYRFVESVASADGSVPEGPPSQPPEGWEDFVGHPEWEWHQLYGLQDLIDGGEGFDRTPEHRVGLVERDREVAVRAWLEANPSERRRLRDYVDLDEYSTMIENIESACLARRVHVPEVLRAGNFGPRSMEEVRSLVRSSPSSNTWATLRYLKHRDMNLPWEQHDWTDMWALSVAIPYCDAVITEKRWAHLAVVGGLADRYETAIGSGRRAVMQELERVLE